MYHLTLGYWNNGCYGQFAVIYIADDFQSFMMEDYDRENDKYIYVRNKLPEHIQYDYKVRPMLEHFKENFSGINSEEDVYDKLYGVQDFYQYEVELPY